MLEIARLIGTPAEKFILQTRLRREVENNQSCEPDAAIRAHYDLLRRGHFAWVNRKPACGVYNCFGLVWANRRTSIYEESAISKILKDDGYRKLATDEQPCPGDIVIYLHTGRENSRNTLHAAILLRLDQLGTEWVPWVLSKWGDAFGEDIHTIKDIPKDFEDCQVELWTDRP
jgi:hypothetical protein